MPGVVHSQIGWTDFKSSKKKTVDFSDFCRFSGFFFLFWVYENFINKKNDFNSELLNKFLQKLLDFFMIFEIFSNDFLDFFMIF
jgi:hypothetical protein